MLRLVPPTNYKKVLTDQIMNKDILIYQAKSGKIEFRGDFKKDTVWGNLSGSLL